jgi:hypothetical protein
VLVLLDLWQRPEVQSQVLLPAIIFHQHCNILQSNQLLDVDPCHSGVLHNTSNLRQSVHSGLSESLLEISHDQENISAKKSILIKKNIHVQKALL